ncbi:glycosyltransferase involved in cell wall biosynthesis [Haloferula luteola]|uniref:Glycosyltransferase involved in cell wall biosynthesis n=1 Tax=Haloferula luteola TaxID=595692 RepID=A0A840VDA5_9BACT|nr:glycosyltransferase family 4 protein [Haloferula luteola]MBB5350831.1 glycosyltransferase involved in cell wall biosynthesis [Haloferula luteola]
MKGKSDDTMDQKIEKIRICLIYHFFPHYRAAVIEELAKAWDNVRFVASDDAEPLGYGIRPLIPDGDFNAVAIRRVFGAKYCLKGLGRLIPWGRGGHAIFLGDMNCVSTWVYGFLLRVTGTKVYFWAHGWLRENESFTKKQLRRMYFKIPHRVFVYGRRARRIAVENGFEPGRVHVIYNSLQYSLQRQLRENASRLECRTELRQLFEFGDRDGKVLLCSARMTPVKKFDQVIHAVSKLSQDFAIGVVFVGDGPEKSQLELLSKELGVPCRFLGACYSEPELSRYFIGCDAVISPGNVGLTAMHAMAYGTPVVSHSDRDTQMPEAEVVIPGVTGELFEKDSVSSLADAIRRVVSRSEEEVNFQARACISIIETFYNASHQVKKIMEAISNVDEDESIRDDISIDELNGLKA